MPELPEVETIQRQLAPLVTGRKLLRMQVLDPRWSAPLAPHELAGALEGRRIESLSRRGKYLLWSFAGDVYLAQHLRMTGALFWQPRPKPAHVRVRMLLSPRHELVVVDQRRFGTATLLLGGEARDAFFAARLGIEPFDERFTAERLRALAKGRTTPIKALLLDQRRIAGIGNIYADEALFGAGIHPLREAGRLTAAQHADLRAAVIATLRAGIGAQGASIDDFRHIDGLRGAFQDQFLIHRRAGERCPRCGGEIVKLRAAGRGSYVCETCQPRPRARSRARRPARSGR